SAIFYSIINICQAGDEIVSANTLYGGTYTMFKNILPQFGITVKFVDPRNPKNFCDGITEKTKLVYCETVTNPGLEVADLEAIAAIARDNGLPFVVDSTFTTPYLMRPIEHGADIVVHSLTKWLGGHGTGIGGVVVDSGKFDWTSGKFPLMSEPEASYHGLRWAHDLGPLAPLAYILRMRLIPLRNLGACISPDNAWIFLQGIETLHLRMQRHCENAIAVAEFLQQHPAVEWVRYPGLDTDKAHTVAQRYLKKGFGAMVVFGIKGGAEAGQKFIERLGLFSHLANVGDAKSLAIHPSSTTHSQLSEADLESAGIAPGLIRLAIGIEDIDDILNDLKQALMTA
ncbi:MAG: aminotransferase class V-fold PLP-dependent enzyme, partial [Cyanobacteria bacterium J06648_11]